MWRWNSFLRAQCPVGKRSIYINMDETCIRMCPESSRGLVYVKRGEKKKHVLEREQKATLSMRRSACSLVAFNCLSGRQQQLGFVGMYYMQCPKK